MTNNIIDELIEKQCDICGRFCAGNSDKCADVKLIKSTALAVLNDISGAGTLRNYISKIETLKQQCVEEEIPSQGDPRTW